MAITLISRVSANDKTGSTTCTYPQTPTIHHLLLCAVQQDSSSTTQTLSGWTLVKTQIAGTTATSVLALFAKNSTGNESVVTPTPGSGGSIVAMSICEYAGCAYPYILDGTPVGNTSSSNGPPATTGAITTTNPQSLIFSVCQTLSIGSETSPSWTTSTLILSGAQSTVAQWCGQYLPGTTKTSFTDTTTWTTGAVWATITAAFKPVDSNFLMFM